MPATGSGDSVVLIVDDEQDIRDLMRELLADEGYHACVASSGDEALELIGRHPPDVILLDLMLPGLGAADFCRAYRAGGGVAPVVVMSAAAPDVVAATAASCEAAAYLLKPFDVDELLRTIAGLATVEELDARPQSGV